MAFHILQKLMDSTRFNVWITLTVQLRIEGLRVCLTTTNKSNSGLHCYLTLVSCIKVCVLP